MVKEAQSSLFGNGSKQFSTTVPVLLASSTFPFSQLLPMINAPATVVHFCLEVLALLLDYRPVPVVPC